MEIRGLGMDGLLGVAGMITSDDWDHSLIPCYAPVRNVKTLVQTYSQTLFVFLRVSKIRHVLNAHRNCRQMFPHNSGCLGCLVGAFHLWLCRPTQIICSGCPPLLDGGTYRASQICSNLSGWFMIATRGSSFVPAGLGALEGMVCSLP